VPEPGGYLKIFDSDAERFGGSAYNRQQRVEADAHPVQGYAYRLRVHLPPLAAVFLRPDR
jgi:1,4-alpha-glucan branching enzyme